MSGADHSRPTREFNTSELAELLKKHREPAPKLSTATGTTPPPSLSAVPTPLPPEQSARGTRQLRSRRNTVEDPMTTQVLAEVARVRETLEFDNDLVAQVTENLSPADKPHPHTRRRTR